MEGFVLPSAVEFAFAGALGIQLLGPMELAKVPKSQRPDFRAFIYWIPFVIHPLLGGGLAWAYIASGETLAPLVAVYVGVTAPLFIRTLADSADRPIHVEPDA